MSIITTDCGLKEETLYGLVENYAKEHRLSQTLSVLPYARKKHEGQYRKGKERYPYFCHPLKVAWHGICMGIGDDDVISAALLHDVCEDCGVAPSELPVNDRTRQLVLILTRDFEAESKAKENEEAYYQLVLTNKDAFIIKLLDRCNNISEMSEGFTDDRLERYIKKTEKYVIPMMEKGMVLYPEYEKEIFLIHYHITSVISAAKRALA